MYNSTQLGVSLHIPVSQRVNPTVVSTTGASDFSFYRNGDSDQFNGFLRDNGSFDNCRVGVYNGGLTGTAGWAGLVVAHTAGDLACDAEI